ncbi:MAG TPA: methionyl-tRNA formyltransferase [Vicinamibacterales bacterium]|nr:methionyl-tRNA formyltransferase [Vicinamibacterales bacterium]
MRVVFFGTPQFAVPSLEQLIQSAHDVVGVVTQPDRPRGRGQKVTDAPVKVTAVQHGLPVFQPARLRDPEVKETLTRWAPELGVVAAYGKILPESVLNLPRFGMINVHASLLPRYRGAAPVQRAVIDGMPETGVTIMRMVLDLDAGGMFAKVTRPIGSDETSDIVERDLAHLGASLLLDVIDDLAAGRAVEEPQNDSLSTYASKITKEEGLIDWTLAATDIHNRVRGLYPWPHAFSYLNGERLIVMRSHVAPEPTSADPGTIVDVSSRAISVATGHGERLAIDEVQPEGRRAMKVRDYLAGHPIQPGTRFNAP